MARLRSMVWNVATMSRASASSGTEFSMAATVTVSALEDATIAQYFTTMKTAGLQHQSNRMATQR